MQMPRDVIKDISLTSTNEVGLEGFVGTYVEIHSLNTVIVICGLSFFWNVNEQVTVPDSLEFGASICFSLQKALEGTYGKWFM